MTQPPDHHVANLDLEPELRGITFLRNTTTTRVEREADGRTEVSVNHRAWFTIEAGAVSDQIHRYGKQKFAPLSMTVDWHDGKLNQVRVTGPRRLKSGALADVRGGGARETEWRHSELNPDADPAELGTYSPGPLPRVIADRVKQYELAVATLTGGTRQ